MADLIRIHMTAEGQQTTSKNLSPLLISLNVRWMWKGPKQICRRDISQNGLSSNPSFAPAYEGDPGLSISAEVRLFIWSPDSWIWFYLVPKRHHSGVFPKNVNEKTFSFLFLFCGTYVSSVPLTTLSDNSIWPLGWEIDFQLNQLRFPMVRLGVIKETFIKCRFYYSSGIVRPMGGEMAALEKGLSLTVPERRGAPHPGGHAWKYLGPPRVAQEAEGVRGKSGQEPLVGTAGRKEWASRVSRLRVGWLEQFLKAQGQREGSELSDPWPWGDWDREVVAAGVKAW